MRTGLAVLKRVRGAASTQSLVFGRALSSVQWGRGLRQDGLGVYISSSRRPIAHQQQITVARAFSTFASSSTPIHMQHIRRDQRNERSPWLVSSPLSSHQGLLRGSGIHLQQLRGLLHIPFLGLLTPKVIAALAMKKAVVVAILKKYGIKGTFDLLRDTNEQLAKQFGPAAYPPAAKVAVKAGLDALEMSISKMEPNEQAEMLWRWLKNVDPTLMVETFKRYVSLAPTPVATETKEEKVQTEEEIRAINAIAAQFPDICQKYDIVLVEKDPVPDPSFQSKERVENSKV